MDFENVTGHAFDLAIRGRMQLRWNGQTGESHDTPVNVTFSRHDASTGNRTTLWTRRFTKPKSDRSVGSVFFQVDIPSFRVDPSDQVRWTVQAEVSSGARPSWIMLYDRDLQRTRTGLVGDEHARRASPPNPLTLDRGVTSRPVTGATWDQVIASSTAGAFSDFLLVGFPQAGLPTAFGTLPVDPFAALTSPPGVPFRIPVPNDPALVGAMVSAQGSVGVEHADRARERARHHGRRPLGGGATGGRTDPDADPRTRTIGQDPA